ncbi:hypothetical protein FRB94_002311, partial [Tulasnella sp. JGI-2019a]
VLERLRLALDTISAVEYLHNLGLLVIHGNIRSLNVLISDERRAILCDFGLTMALDEGETDLSTYKEFKGYQKPPRSASAYLSSRVLSAWIQRWPI